MAGKKKKTGAKKRKGKGKEAKGREEGEGREEKGGDRCFSINFDAKTSSWCVLAKKETSKNSLVG